MVGPLPIGQLENPFLRKAIALLIQRVEGFAHFIDQIAPPLRTLPVRAVKIGVAHRNIQRA